MHRIALALLLLALPVLGACGKDPIAARDEFERRGDAYVAAGQLHEAIIEYRNALQHDPLAGAIRVKLADTYREVGDRDNAALELVRAADALPDDLALQLRAGNTLLLYGRFEDAVARADRVLSAEPSNVDALILRAHGLAGLRRLDEAIADIESAVDNDPDRAASYITLGSIQLVRGDREQAARAFEQAVAAAPSSVQARLALANYRLASGDQAGAEAELRRALEIDPGHLLANRALAYFYIGAGRHEEGERYLKAAADAAGDASGQLTLAEYYLARGRTDDARALLERVAAGDAADLATKAALRLATLDFRDGRADAAARRVDDVLARYPSNAAALAAKAELLAADGDLDGALAAVERAVTSDRSSALAHYAAGKVRLLRGESADAVAAFTAAIQLDTRLVPARVELAALHLAAGRIEEARQMAESALAVAPQSADAQLLLARALLAGREPARAEQILRDLERRQPASAAVATAVGRLELSKGSTQRARAAFERALRLDAGAIEPLRYLTQLDINERRIDAARRRVTAALAGDPQRPALLLLASEVAEIAGDPAEAERLARTVLEVAPSASDAYARLAEIYGRSGRLQEATEEFQRLSRQQPESAGPITAVGVLLQMQGRDDEARQAYEQALGIDPRAAIAANNLAWMYAERGEDLDAALRLAQVAKAHLPAQPAVNDTLGWIYHLRGASELAIGPLEEAVRGAPSTAQYHFHLAHAYMATGDRTKARAALERALELEPDAPFAAEASRLMADLR